MRELTVQEMHAVSGGKLTAAQSVYATLALLALVPTPLTMAVGGAAILVYAFC